jgi:hypothetical protein
LARLPQGSYLLEGKSKGIQVTKDKRAANNGMKRIVSLVGHSRLCRALGEKVSMSNIDIPIEWQDVGTKGDVPKTHKSFRQNHWQSFGRLLIWIAAWITISST